MNILFITSAHNSLSQRLLIELTTRGHRVSVALATSTAAMEEAVQQHAPELIIAPMLKVAIPVSIWSRIKCLIVHPGIKGDRGASSLDWAILRDEPRWGVTVLEAAEEFDAGDIWATREFPLAGIKKSKGSLYRHEVTAGAVDAVLDAIEKFQSGHFVAESLDYDRPDVQGCLRPIMRQSERQIDWENDTTATIARKIRASDTAPGVLDSLFNTEFYLYGVHEEDRLKGKPGAILAQRDGAICRGTVDGAVWISHMKVRTDQDATLTDDRFVGIKLPAAQVLGRYLKDVRKSPLAINSKDTYRSFREIRYEEHAEVGYLYFDFYNGAMSTEQCYRLREYFLYARSRPTKVIVLMGGADYFSNGIHLNVIEAAENPAQESWRNINAINDLIYEILITGSHMVVSAMRGNAGAGGAMMALAADIVYARDGIVINPHYRGMGGLYGSEYWTYTLPRRVGPGVALTLTESCEPLGTQAAQAYGFIDAAFGTSVETFTEQVQQRVAALGASDSFWQRLRDKHEERILAMRRKPLADYRAEELAKMWVNFFGPDPAYHVARRNFVYKGNPPALSTVHRLKRLA